MRAIILYALLKNNSVCVLNMKVYVRNIFSIGAYLYDQKEKSRFSEKSGSVIAGARPVIILMS